MGAVTVRAWKRIGDLFYSNKQRISALFLFVVFLASIITPTVSAVVLQQEESQIKTSDYPGAMQPVESTAKAAADALPAPQKSSLATINDAGAPLGEALQEVADQPEIIPRELTDRRTATSSTSVNADGSLTEKHYFTPKHYKKEGAWKTIDTTLVEDKNAGDSGNIFGQALGQVQSWFSSTTHFTVKENDWQARFGPSDFEGGMIRIQKGNDQIGFEPVGAKKVAPVVTTDKKGKQTVHYYDLWPGVNVEYSVESAAVKENIVIKDKNAANAVSFRLVGASLERPQTDDRAGPAFTIKGAFNDEFGVAPANLILDNFGLVTDSGVFEQTYENGIITVSVDKSYLQNLPDEAFPAVVDPIISNFGTREGGTYISFKIDGYICYSNVCNPYAGSLYDSNWIQRWWRSAVHAPYDQFKDPNKILTKATLHLKQRSNESFWTGDWGHNHRFQVGHATCLNSFYCMDGTWHEATFTDEGNIDVTNLYKSFINNGDFGAWIMIAGEDGSDHSFTNFDPGTGHTTGSYVEFTYGGAPSAPSIASPTADQVYADPQPSFQVSQASNPNGSTPLQYELLVSSAPGASGGRIASGRLSATQWTIPDGILQDGSTYYVQARSFDPITNSYSDWGTAVPFRIDMRTGKGKTQTYDSLGPVDVDLATGNVATSAASHSSAALGGSLGVSLDYNSPLKSRNGLVGQYWNNDNLSGDPLLTRVDRNIEFGWHAGSPSGGTIPNDNFSARWTGYFVAPETGTYEFASDIDDGCRIWVDNQQVVNDWNWCGTQWGSSMTLEAGQVVPLKVEYRENGGHATARLLVRGVVSSGGMVVPPEWLQTGVRPIANQKGLTGHYYFDDGTHTFDSDKMFMQRNDALVSFNWGGGPTVAGGPKDSFLARWTGYFIPPVSGTYEFGTNSSDGSRIYVGTNNALVMNKWQNSPGGEQYGNGVALTAGQPVPITVEYFENNGNAAMYLLARGAVSAQVVPSAWLTPKAQVLPDGWNLGLDPSGNVSYDRIKINQNSVVLIDSTGSTHEYIWTGGSYKPPVNEDGHLVRNEDGTFTLQDLDGRTYVFNADGTLSSVTTPADDREPAALQYTYGSINGGPATLTQITDAVDNSRWAKVFYSGDNECGSAPSGFDVVAPAGMLCAVKTNDGRATFFYYVDGQLSRIAGPGNEAVDYQYEEITNSSGATIGYRLAGIRDAAANDTIAAGVRPDDDTVKTQIGYDVLGRATTITQPAPTESADRIQHTVEYLPGFKSYVDENGNLIPGYQGITKQHVAGATEPHGFTRRIKYDNLLRTIEDTDIANLTIKNEWDPKKDVLFSTTDESGLKSTTIYDDEDRPIEGYGPAPKEWYGSDRKPLPAHAGQVPRTDTAYDEGITGLGVTYMATNLKDISDTLGPNQSLARGQDLWSVDRRFRFVHQWDGNVVLAGPSGVLWASGTNGAATTHLIMQWDGNLVLCNGSTPIWATGTDGEGASTLKVQNDGNTVIYRSSGGTSWATNTGGQASAPYPVSLVGTPKLHSTNLASDGTISKDFGSSSPIPDYSGRWGVRMTGKMRLPQTGNYSFRIHSDGGARLYIDDKLVVDDWYEGAARNHPTGTFNNTEANAPHRVRVEYFHGYQNNATFGLYLTPPGGQETAQVAQYFSPDYGLVTSAKTYDSTIGDTVATTDYGANPELGLAQSTTVDPGGLDLSASATYEQQGATGSFLRQTSKTLPGGNTTSYGYYTAGEVRDNPCTVETEAFKQAGFMKFKTEPSPDGSTGGGGGGGSGSTAPVVQSSTSGTTGSGALTLNKPSGTVDGDLLIMTASADLSENENVSYTVPSGWTELLPLTRSHATNAGSNLQVWYKIASSEPADYAITPDHSNLIGGSIVRVDGQAASDFIHQTEVTASDDNGEASAPSVTTTVDSALVMRLATWDQSKTLLTAPSGHTQAYHVDVSGHDNWGGYKEQTTAGSTGAAQFDLSSDSPYVGFTVAIAPESSGGQGGGGSSANGRKTEVIYDDAGRTVASRMNNDDWACTTYDERGRAVQAVVPTINGRPGRTVTTNYNYQGNPLKVQAVDSVAGTAVSEVDLLGRPVSSTDVFGNTATVAYDSLGRTTSKTSPLGTESYTYDQYSRVTEYFLDGTKYATVTYDAYSRIQDVTYNQAKEEQTQQQTTTPAVQSSTSGTTGSGMLTLGKPDGTVNGDLLIMTASADLSESEDVSYTVDSGWTALLPLTRSDASGAGSNLQVWYKIANNEPADYTITPDHSNLIGGSIVRVDGHDPNDPIDESDVTASASGEASAPSVTTTVDNTLALRLATWDQSKTVNAIPSGHTQTYHVDVSGHDNWGGYKEQATAGSTGVAQFDLSSDSPYVGFTVAVNPAGSGGSQSNTLKLEQVNRDALQRAAGATYRFSDGTAFDETVAMSQSGKVTSYTDTFGGSSVTNTYAYDKAGRLTGANIDTNTYTYGYGAPTGCSGTYNANAHKNSNRTSFTVNGATTTYCYDQADRLLSSSDTQLGTPTYDDHGNTISLAGNGEPITFGYNAQDQNTTIEQGDYKVEYVKTASGAVLRKKEYQNNQLTASYRYLGGGAVLQTCSLSDENSCATTDKYLGLPGGVTLTLSPENPDPAKRTVYSIQNFHGDTAMTVDEEGNPTSSPYLYEPYGQPSSSVTFGTNSNPANATDQSMGWAASPTRKVAGAFTVPIIQMGARVYLPTAGRFLQTDPIEGGTPNSYTYPPDPINGNDYTGLLSVRNSSSGNIRLTVTYNYGMQYGWGGNSLQSSNTVARHIQPASTARLQGPGAVRGRISVPKTTRQASRPVTITRRPQPTLNRINVSNIPNTTSVRGYGTGDLPLPDKGRFDWISAGDAAADWYNGGKLTGGVVGCGVGALLTLYAAGAGCTLGAPVGAAVTAPVFTAWGFVTGGFDLPTANAFDWLPDMPMWW